MKKRQMDNRQKAGIGWSELWERVTTALWDLSIFIRKELHKEVGLLHTAEKGGRVCGLQLVQG